MFSKQHAGIYQPLDLTHKQIRLLYLEDISTSGIIRGALRTVHLDEMAGKYNALSYVWGPRDVIHTISINGHEHQIRSNLHDCLCTLKARQEQAHSSSLQTGSTAVALPTWVDQIYDNQDEEEERELRIDCLRTLITRQEQRHAASLHNGSAAVALPIWVDQICINQDDQQEKESQIPLMNAIYSSAVQTIVWLGTDPHDGLALACLRKTYDGALLGMSALEFWDWELNCTEVTALHHLLRLPYWSRHWVLQEICLSRHRLLLFGDAELAWEDFVFSLDSVHRCWAIGRHYVGSDCAIFVDMVAGFEKIDRTKLWETATDFTVTSLCEDPRDKIYGMQGLFPADRRIEVDYMKSVQDVYFAVVEKNFPFMLQPQRLVTDAQGCLALAIGMRVIEQSHMNSVDTGIIRTGKDIFNRDLHHATGRGSLARQMQWPEFEQILRKILFTT
jgi:hypothetical protein